MKFFKLSIFILTAVLLLSSCEKQQPQSEETVQFTMTKNSLGSGASSFWVGIQASEESVSWTLRLSFAEGEDAWAALKAADGSLVQSLQGSGNATVLCSYQADTSTASRSMTLHLTPSSGQTVSYSISQQGVLPPGAYPAWMELPAPDNKYDFHPHSFTKNYITYRNYSIGWSSADHLSLWVAYPLNSSYTSGSAGYTGTWSYDPVVSTKGQPCLNHGFSCSSERIDRGHQLPSADRQCCAAANNQTFYFTNMTPQRNGFNTGIWVNLEGKVRSYASKSDTLYVVTGAVVGSNPKYAYDNLGVACPIPSHYFKAVLSYKNKTSVAHNGWQAAGFWLDHDNYSGLTIRSCSLSIRSLEAKLGYDLFPNLKAAVGESLYNTIENETPTSNSFWGL